MDFIKLHDKEFKIYIPCEKIISRVSELSNEINSVYQKKTPVILVVLNGAFLFASELMKNFTFNNYLSFIKISSYEAMNSSGNIKTTIGLPENLKGKDILIIEDIVDTGLTVEYLYAELAKVEPNSIKIASLLLKPDAYKKTIPIDYVGFEIPNEFVVGFGLDYNEFGRNLPNIYSLHI